MSFAIKITTTVNKTQINSYLVEVKEKEVITSPQLIKAAIFGNEFDCNPHISSFRNISDKAIARAIHVTSETDADLGRISSSLLV